MVLVSVDPEIQMVDDFIKVENIELIIVEYSTKPPLLASQFGVHCILPVFEEVQTIYSSFQFSLAWFWPSTKLLVEFSMTGIMIYNGSEEFI